MDAGYLFAAGSQAICGVKRRRIDLALDIETIVAALSAFANRVAPEDELLRVYWYDGVGGGKETDEQRRIAESSNVKARFGVINSIGEQKGVDSLLFTDLVDLAREHAIASAIVLTGDEDLRVGVEIAQRYGVRVHLLGIVPARGNQSWLLRREADTTNEWDASTVASFLSILAPVPAAAPVSWASDTGGIVAASYGADAIAPVPFSAAQVPASDLAATWKNVAEEFARQLTPAQREEILWQWEDGNGVAPAYDRSLLASAGRIIVPRQLAFDEKRTLRENLMSAIRGYAAEEEPASL